MSRSTRADGAGEATGVRLRAAIVVAVAVLALLAGYTALSGDDAAPTYDDSTGPVDDEVDGDATAPGDDDPGASQPVPTLAEAGVDVNATWNRTKELVGVEAERPTVAVTRRDSEYGYERPAFVGAVAGVDAEGVFSSSGDVHPQYDAVDGGYVLEDVRVVVFADEVEARSASELESLLAHQFTHAIQYEHGWIGAHAPPARGSDALAAVAYAEGMGTYVQTAYEQRFHADDAPSYVEGMWRRYANDTAADRYPRAPYLFGARYWDRVVDDPSELPANAAAAPNSSTELLHGVDRRRPLTVDADYAFDTWRVDDAFEFRSQSVSRQGELATRLVLGEHLSASAAADAAAGWANDDLTYAESASREESGHVWVHRWNGSSEADEFVAAAETFVDRRNQRPDDARAAVHRLADETTAIVAGDPSFHDAVDVDADSNASVTVALPE